MKPRLLPLICVTLIASYGSVATVSAQQDKTILTDNVVELRESISSNGFVHPGISCNAQTLSIMREKVIAGVSPWADYFEGMRRTRFADLNRKPARVEQILNDGGIGGFAYDAHLAWTQTILYVVTGNEEYRKLPVEIIKWYGSRTDKNFFPQYFSDSHIKIGKYVYTMCSAVDILRATNPKDQKLAVTQEMVDALQKNCMYPIRKNCIERNNYFMNQHSYAIMGYLASAIMGDEVADYKQAVEWTTVNASSPNQGRSGSIKQQIRLVTRDDKTGEAVEPNLQLVEMGRDMPHAEGNLTNLLMMSKTIDFQKTKVDPVDGTVTDKADGVSPVHFLDDRLAKGLALYVKFNLGYGLPWVPVYSETDPTHSDYLGRYDQLSPRGRGSGVAASSYYYFKGIGLDFEKGPYRYIKADFDGAAAGRGWARSGGYLDNVHNYGFDFWIGLSAAASDAAPDPLKAKRALATVLPALEVTYNGVPVKGLQCEYQFVDLSAHAQPGDVYPGSPRDIPLKVTQDSDGTRYVRMSVEKDPRTMVLRSRFPSGAALRVRCTSSMKLNFYRDEDFTLRGSLQELYVPDTQGEWRDLIMTFEGSGLTYVHATPMAAAGTLDFDRVETEKSAVRPLAFDTASSSVSIPAFIGGSIRRVFTATGGSEPLTYSAVDLPAGAELGSSTGVFSWTPKADQANDHVFYIVARNGDTICTLQVQIQVGRDLQAAIERVALAHDPAQRYTTATEQAFKAALASRDLVAIKRAVGELQLVNPRLPDGTLNYRTATSPAERGTNINMMADNDPFTWGGIWGFDKNITLDFGNQFKVRCDAFRLQTRDGFPSRLAGAVVYGSNDRQRWTLLTSGTAVASQDMQTLTVKEEERNKPYRYLRLFKPANTSPIFEVAEFRIVGERIEDHSPDFHRAYIAGYSDGTFRPDHKVTKAEAACVLAGLVDDYTDRGAYSCDFVDVPRTAPYFDDIAYMSSKGIGNTWSQPVKYVTADPDNRFHPEAPISRGELAGIMARMRWLKGNGGPQLKDVAADTPNAAEIRRVTAKGWLTTDGQNEFRPNDSVTRAEFVTAVNRMLGRYDAGGRASAVFKDIDASHPAYGEIMEASQTHTVSAYSDHFLFVTFRGEQDPQAEQVYFNISTDGSNWSALNRGNPVLVSTIGEKGVRDPYLLRSYDRKRFYLIATDLSWARDRSVARAKHAGSRSLVIWESADLIHWGEPRLVAVAPDDAGCAWAPEAIYDEDKGDYMVFWASTTKADNFAKHRIWMARTTDFRQFSKPQVYIDRPYPVIDTTIVRDGDRYYRFSKREDQGTIFAESSERLTGDWKPLDGFGLSTLRGVEGPQCFMRRVATVDQRPQWCLLLDHYARGEGYKAYETDRIADGRFRPAAAMKAPFPPRHGSVLAISADEFEKLKQTYGAE